MHTNNDLLMQWPGSLHFKFYICCFCLIFILLLSVSYHISYGSNVTIFKVFSTGILVGCNYLSVQEPEKKLFKIKFFYLW